MKISGNKCRLATFQHLIIYIKIIHFQLREEGPWEEGWPEGPPGWQCPHWPSLNVSAKSAANRFTEDSICHYTSLSSGKGCTRAGNCSRIAYVCSLIGLLLTSRWRPWETDRLETNSNSPFSLGFMQNSLMFESHNLTAQYEEISCCSLKILSPTVSVQHWPKPTASLVCQKGTMFTFFFGTLPLDWFIAAGRKKL